MKTLTVGDLKRAIADLPEGLEIAVLAEGAMGSVEALLVRPSTDQEPETLWLSCFGETKFHFDIYGPKPKDKIIWQSPDGL
jgi:hypothetical protein